MTVIAPETLAGQEIGLLGQLNDVLRRHPESALSAFRLIFAPAAVDIAEDEVFVQVVDAERGVVELHPRKLSDIQADDVIHATQIVGLPDVSFVAHAASKAAAKCTRWSTGGQSGHAY